MVISNLHTRLFAVFVALLMVCMPLTVVSQEMEFISEYELPFDEKDIEKPQEISVEKKSWRTTIATETVNLVIAFLIAALVLKFSGIFKSKIHLKKRLPIQKRPPIQKLRVPLEDYNRIKRSLENFIRKIDNPNLTAPDVVRLTLDFQIFQMRYADLILQCEPIKVVIMAILKKLSNWWRIITPQDLKALQATQAELLKLQSQRTTSFGH